MSDKNLKSELNDDLSLEIKTMKDFEKLLEEEKITNPEFSDINFQADLVNSYLKNHSGIDVVELQKNKKKG